MLLQGYGLYFNRTFIHVPMYLVLFVFLNGIVYQLLLVGTSGTVSPAAQMPLVAKRQGARLIEVNLYETKLTPRCNVTLTGPSGHILPLLVERLLRNRSLP